MTRFRAVKRELIYLGHVFIGLKIRAGGAARRAGGCGGVGAVRRTVAQSALRTPLHTLSPPPVRRIIPGMLLPWLTIRGTLPKTLPEMEPRFRVKGARVDGCSLFQAPALRPTPLPNI